MQDDIKRAFRVAHSLHGLTRFLTVGNAGKVMKLFEEPSTPLSDDSGFAGVGTKNWSNLRGALVICHDVPLGDMKDFDFETLKAKFMKTQKSYRKSAVVGWSWTE